MSRVLPGTAPYVTAQTRVDLAPAATWIEAHYEAFRGQWVAVRLQDPVLVASAPTLHQLWQMTPPAQLSHCLLHYVYTVAEEGQPLIRFSKRSGGGSATWSESYCFK